MLAMYICSNLSDKEIIMTDNINEIRDFVLKYSDSHNLYDGEFDTIACLNLPKDIEEILYRFFMMGGQSCCDIAGDTILLADCYMNDIGSYDSFICYIKRNYNMMDVFNQLRDWMLI